MKTWIFVLFTLCLSPLSVSNLWAKSSLEQQRALFWQAQKDLNNGNIGRFKSSLATLKDYPLHYYLSYRYLKSRLSQEPQAVKAFFKAYPQAPLSTQLRYDWLWHLVKTENDAQLIKDYPPGLKSVRLQCHYVAARLQQGETGKAVLDEAVKLWLVGKSQPKACDPVFEHLRQQGLMNDDLLWQRLRLAMLKGKQGLALYLSKQFTDSAYTDRFQRWQQVLNKPAVWLEHFAEPDSDSAQETIYQGIKKLARKDVSHARFLWKKLSTQYRFNAEEKAAMQGELALRSAWSQQADALSQLKALKTEQFDKNLRQVFLQTALQAPDWTTIVDVIQRFPSEAQDEPQWRYWEARALEKLGKSALAQNLFKDLAKERDFYGFMAADRIGQAYQLNHRSTTLPPEYLQALYKKAPGLLRAREFYHLGMTVNARREWQAELSRLKPAELAQAAALARQWCWYDRAIFTAARARHYDDLDMRFPLAYFAQLMAGTEEQEVDMAWAYGIMRQESAFTADIKSHAGAMGLMQLMPATGRAMAKNIGLIIENNREILEPYTNIRLGTTYLKRMLDRFDGNYMFATAAYNAGPGRPARWARENPCLPADMWIEQIPFRETRTYVQRVLTYTVIFDAQMGRKMRPLRLQDVGNCKALK